VKRSHKEYFFYYLKDNILIFDIFDYIEELGSDTVDFFCDWNLLNSDNKIIYKNKIIKEFLTKKITKDVENINRFVLKHYCSTFCYFKQKNDLNLWSNYFEDPIKFIKQCKRLCKNIFPNFIEDKNENNFYFQKIKGQFNGIPCLLPSGEDEIFIQKNIKKSKYPIDI
jgi:hypothetical protein